MAEPITPPSTMRAFVVGADGKGALRSDVPVPVPREGEALVRVLRAGICNTDIELLQGYKGGYTGVLGHEFVGEVVAAVGAPHLLRKRVCGELNISCGACTCCERKGSRARNHCLNRTVLGIWKHDGTFAEYLTLPHANLHLVPENVSTEEAVFIEPLAAALRIVEQGLIKPDDKVCVLGDGKLGLLVAEVLACQQLAAKPVLVGRHPAKMALVGGGIQPVHSSRGGTLPANFEKAFDVVVEATGTPEGLMAATNLAVPEGTIVLKSTCASSATIDTSALVVGELKVVGSRCGPFDAAIELVSCGRVKNISKYVDAVLPLEDVHKALELAGTRGALKVQLAIASSELSSVGKRPPPGESDRCCS